VLEGKIKMLTEPDSADLRNCCMDNDKNDVGAVPGLIGQDQGSAGRERDMRACLYGGGRVEFEFAEEAFDTVLGNMTIRNGSKIVQFRDNLPHSSPNQHAEWEQVYQQ
jgi:hypothetical protein